MAEEKINSIFDAIRSINELKKAVGGDLKRLTDIEKLKYKELQAYVDILLKDEAEKKVIIVIKKHPKGPDEPMVCEIHFNDAVQFYESLHLYIGKGGCFIKTENFFPIDSLCEMDFIIGKENVKFKLTSKVIWVNPKPSGGRPAGMGVKFYKLNSVQREVLENFINGEVSPEALIHLGES